MPHIARAVWTYCIFGVMILKFSEYVVLASVVIECGRFVAANWAFKKCHLLQGLLHEFGWLKSLECRLPNCVYVLLMGNK